MSGGLLLGYMYQRGIPFCVISRTYQQERTCERSVMESCNSGYGNLRGGGVGWGYLFVEPPDNRETSTTAGAANGSGG